MPPPETAPPSPTSPALLVVGGDAGAVQTLLDAAAKDGWPWQPHWAATVPQAREMLAAHEVKLLLALPPLDGGALADLAAALSPESVLAGFVPGAEADMAAALELDLGACFPLDEHGRYLRFLPQLLAAARRRAQLLKRQRDNVALLERVSQMASVGGWLLDMVSGEVLWTPETRRIHDVPPDFVPTTKNVSSFYAPESRDAVKRDIARFNRQGHPWSREVELMTPAGRRVWTKVQGQTEYADGQPSRVWGTIQDISEHKRTEIALTQTSRLLEQKTQDLRVTLDSISQGIVKVEPDGHMSVANHRFLELLELPESLFVDNPTMGQIIAYQTSRGDFGERFEWVESPVRSYVERGVVHGGPDSYLRKTRWGGILEVKTRDLPNGGIVRTYTDMSNYFKAQQALQRSETRFRSLTQLSSDWYWEQDKHYRFVPVDSTVFKEAGELMAAHLGKAPWEIGALNMTEADWAAHRAELEARRVFRDLELHMQGEGEQQVWIAISGMPIFDEDGAFLGYHGVGRNITERKGAERKIERLAFYDALTGLPNRRLLIDRLKLAVASCMRHATHGALLFIDLDNFKTLNDTLGHHMGDQLLRQVADRLGQCVREIDTVARLGGDEFVVMLEELSGTAHDAAQQAEGVGKKVLLALNRQFELAGQEHHSSPSIGVTLFSDQQQSVDDLLKRADLAMYQAKAAGRNTLRFFDPDMQAAASARAAMEADLRQSMQRRELLLYYQPVVDENSRVTGVEALLRWRHPTRGLVLPGEFIALAEQSGLILGLGQWVLESACAQLVAWNGSPATRSLSIAVNVSARQFRHPEFARQILTLLRQTGANPYRLKLELTESLLLSDMNDAIQKMTELRSIGVSFALDDFGTGYSSLSYLKRLPLDQLKIDQSFVRDVLSDPNDAAIARTILTLAKSLDLSVVAEGVETTGQRDFLRKAGCKAFQGYLFGRPAPIEELQLAPAGAAPAKEPERSKSAAAGAVVSPR
jgi:diguanylate cyclase (GGDEF)-like protein/PAS domain S-box-containing protein